MHNLLTFDIEEWFHANYEGMDPGRYRGQGSRFAAQMDEVLQLCSEYKVHATFFVLGCIGEDYPEIVRRIAATGHDVASHGYGHQLAYKQTLPEFKADVARSVGILENVTGQKVRGYRAPSWSIIRSNYHYLAALEELGLQYDASVFPVKTFLYGIPDAPKAIHHPVVEGRTLNLHEVPMSVVQLAGRNMGFSGGFYFRFFPGWLIRRWLEKTNQAGRPAILYLHPRELDPLEQKLNLPAKEAFIHYYHVQGNKEKLASMMRRCSFTSIAAYLQGR